MLRELREIAQQFNKQIIYSTHSAELIKHETHTRILDANRYHPAYLNTREQKIPLLAGIGSEYTPRLADVEQHRRILFVENESDEAILRELARTLGTPLPDSFVVWPWASGHKERKYVHLELRKLLTDIISISLVDRDMQTIASTDLNLQDKVYGDDNAQEFRTRKWRRRHIEGYLLHPDAIARATGRTPDEIIQHVAKHHALDISARVTDQSEPELLLQANGKSILEEHEHSIENVFHVSKYDVVKQLQKSEIPRDVAVIVNEICETLGR